MTLALFILKFLMRLLKTQHKLKTKLLAINFAHSCRSFASYVAQKPKQLILRVNVFYTLV